MGTGFCYKQGLADLHRRMRELGGSLWCKYGLDLRRLLAQRPRRLGNEASLYRLGSLTLFYQCALYGVGGSGQP